MAASRAQSPNMQAARIGQRSWRLGVLCACLLSPGGLAAQAQPREEGVYFTVPVPITREVVNRIKSATQRALEANNPPIRKIVYDFNPGGRPSTTADYGDCRDLADFILKRRSVKTIAFVHGDVTGHAVLPVLACQEIVMSNDARLGDAVQGTRESLEDDQIRFYENLARGRRPAAVVLKMADKDLPLAEAVRVDGGAVTFIDLRKQDEERKKGIAVSKKDPVLPAGTIGLYSATQAQRLGLCDLRVNTRNDLLESYGLSPASLRGDLLEGRKPVAERVIINATLNRALLESLERRMRQAIGRRGVNAFVIQLEAGSGDTQAGRDFADFLRELKDDSDGMSLLTVAYIPVRATAAATFVALGCTEIVMGPKAELGDFDALLLPGARLQPAERAERVRALEDSLVGLAREQGYPENPVRGMVDLDLVLYRVRSQQGLAQWRVISQAELAADQAGPRVWDEASKMLLKPAGRLLKLDSELARELGFARHVVQNNAELNEIYGFKNVRDISFDFLYELASFLCHPLVSVLLIMVGITSLILELKMPGATFPGIVAALCFVLYFWAQSQLAGQIIMLAVLLFVLGLVLILLELFVFPGFGMPGISGTILVVVSLGLATLEKRPETSSEWLNFGRTLAVVGMGMLGAIALAGLVAWYLPSIPYANRLVLKPRFDDDTTPENAGAPGALGNAADLLGAIGSAATTLRPAGIARFGEQYLDVVSEGSFIEAGSRVQVIEIEGNRIVVKEI